MLNSISDFYTDDDIICELRGFFDLEEQWNIDFKALLKRVEDYNDIYYTLTIKGRKFFINKINCEIVERKTNE